MKEGMSNQNSGLTEDEFIRQLIAAVKKRPVLYDVHLFDYKNKNKKGENFKEIQQELRDAGASEQQVQFIYKKWISIKRKFRVEFFKLQSDDGGKEATCSYPYYESLKFLIPYCQYYKVCSGTKRKANDDVLSSINDYDEDSDEERLMSSSSAVDDEEILSGQNALDFLINQKRVKLECQVNPNPKPDLTLQTLQDGGGSRSPTCSVYGNTNGNILNGNSTSKKNSTKNLPLIPENILANGLIDGLTNGFHFNEFSENALFGHLVGRELDKLPPTVHNLVRAQILVLLAQASSTSAAFSNATNSAAEKLLNNLSSFMQ